jgi:MFS superfamily sulfate permease-like transporter
MLSKLFTSNNLKKDLPAGLVVFLVALPLCLGVALASGAPILSGVISGIVGGIIVGIISNSNISVSGPAAGLTAIVASSIISLGSFQVFLLAVVIAGLFQILSGIAKIGFIADYIPSNVIKGLLASIGIILILKQIPHAVGYDKDYEGDFSFFQPDNQNTFSELVNMLNYFSAGAAIITVISILILIFWEKGPLKNILPAPLLVVILGICLNAFYKNFIPGLYISESHLVNIPAIENLSSIITVPDFMAINNPKVWLTAATLAIVASLETLLNLEAVEKLDIEKRQSSPNRELLAQGIGNSISGLIGGIPLTSVIVRSSVNINVGAKTKISTIAHGIFLLIFVLFAGPLLNLIPLSSLAAILLFTGYKLAKISLFKDMYKKGWNQFIPFIVTIFAIVFTDLLIGIIIGLAVSTFFLLKSNLNYPFAMRKEKAYKIESFNLTLSNQVSFLNKAGIKQALWNMPGESKLTIDAVNSDFIDNDVLEIIEEFKNSVSKEKNIQLNVIGLKNKYNLDDRVDFVDYLDKETLDTLSPADILLLLKEGNIRFVEGRSRRKDYTKQIEAGSNGQNPMAVIVSCIDSRTSPEIIFDLGLGDILSIRIAGNIINDDILGSIELACQKLGAKLVVVLGHSECGAIATAINKIDEGFIGSITQKIEKAVNQCGCDRKKLLEDNDSFNEVVKQNTFNSFNDIISQSTYLREAKESGEINIFSAYYDLKSGIVYFNN